MLALARGFGAKDANELCEPATLAKRCQGDNTCKQCVSDLDRMAWKSSHRACYAITYVDRPSNDNSRIVSVTRGKPNAAGESCGCGARFFAESSCQALGSDTRGTECSQSDKSARKAAMNAIG